MAVIELELHASRYAQGTHQLSGSLHSRTVAWQAAGRVHAAPSCCEGRRAAIGRFLWIVVCNLAGLLDPAAQLKGCSTISTLHVTPHAALYTTAQHIITRHPIACSNSAVCSRHFLARNARL